MMDVFISGVDFRIALLCIVICLFVFIWTNRTQSLPPGPWSLPIIGCVPQVVWGLYRSRLPVYEYLVQLKHVYGNVYCFNICGRKIVFVNSYKAMVEAFNNPYLSDRPKASNSLGKSVDELQSGIVFCNGDIWAQQRRLTVTTLRSFGVGKLSFADKIAEETNALLEEFTQTNEQEFDPKPLLISATSNVICSVAFGRRFDYEDKKFQRLLNLISQQTHIVVTMSGYFVLPILQYLPTASKAIAAFESNSVDIMQFIDEIILEHQERFDPETLQDFIDVYLNEIRLNKNGKGQYNLLHVDSLKATIAQLFGAGSDSTALNIRWVLFYLIANPKIQTRVHREIDDVVGRNRLPKLTNKVDLPYLTAVILESNRIASTGRFSPMHAASKDTVLCDHRIPKDTIVLGNLWAVHYDSKIFEEPYKFNPERFLNKEGKVEQPDELIPFGVGRRFCLGDNLAKMEMFIVLSHLLHQFTFTADGPMTDVGHERIPKKEFKIRAIKRD